MYQRGTRGLLQHLYFIVLDLLCINISFVLTYLVATTFLSYNMPDKDYYKLIVILNVTVLLVSVF